MSTPAPDAPPCKYEHSATENRIRDGRGKLACLECRRQRKWAWHRDNPDKVEAYRQHNLAAYRAAHRRWRATDKGQAATKRQAEKDQVRRTNLTAQERQEQQARDRARYARQSSEQRASNARQKNESRRRRMEKLWEGVLSAYTRFCACCGETNRMFLTVDHMNGGGAAHRKQSGGSDGVLRWLRDHGYPAGFQILCFNCNCGRARNGDVCPHQTRGPA